MLRALLSAADMVLLACIKCLHRFAGLLMKAFCLIDLVHFKQTLLSWPEDEMEQDDALTLCHAHHTIKWADICTPICTWYVYLDLVLETCML